MNYTRAKRLAGELHESLTGAYYVGASDIAMQRALSEDIHETFARLAKQLGYKIEPLEADD